MRHGYDVDAVLRGVVADTFEDDTARDWSPDPGRPRWHQVLLGSGERRAGLRVGGEWCDLTLLPSGNGTTNFFEGSVELEEALRDLARTGRSYLDGRFHVTRHRGLFRTRDVLTVATDDGDRRFWRGPWGLEVAR